MTIPSCRDICVDILDPPESDANIRKHNKDLLVDRFGCAPPLTPDCNPAEFTNRPQDDSYFATLAEEALAIAGADVWIYKYLGVHEQCKLIDAAGYGRAISNGDTPNFPAANAFDASLSEWRCIQRGPESIIARAYIGYDFGLLKSVKGTTVYSIDASIRKHVMAVGLKQSNRSKNRATKIRVERSDDMIKWYGVAVLDIPDDDCLNIATFQSSAPCRYWRVRPVSFNGGISDYWGVQACQLYHNYQATALNNIQDKIFLENRNRDYDSIPVVMKGYYDPQDTQSELLRFGIDLPSQTYTITMSFRSCVSLLGRPVVVGDVINLPMEAQYSHMMAVIPKWLEVTDVSWSNEGITPTWRHILLKVMAQPLYASEETQDIFGDLAPTFDEMGLSSGDDGNSGIWQDYMDVAQTIAADAKDRVPERGATNNIRRFEQEEIDAAIAQGLPTLTKIGQNMKGLYLEDALPPNDDPYTEADEFPDSPKNGDWHRLTYSNLDDDYPARLYRYSTVKARWIYMETDKRAQYSATKPIYTEMRITKVSTPNAKITNNRKDMDDC